ncbi:hypothetical protein TRIATDRAFT_89158 [Trichoderma atroviride IMI 206040]|uniref:Uncharacterized protein n=1 Tax=Hypocrea atroviridis (strain ATCC 20476 / IMI 206040) TaxID=452589 RepID=G9PAG2_HYPAI|nr:uncharacterized protein TRIATDRAFT_89158 [Trichoderma atroviride IMI 206040]EHK40503.1 hypothetical protein TRIATDRAFT_89158 [Trichoderma atroviride IMI 206040]
MAGTPLTRLSHALRSTRDGSPALPALASIADIILALVRVCACFTRDYAVRNYRVRMRHGKEKRTDYRRMFQVLQVLVAANCMEVIHGLFPPSYTMACHSKISDAEKQYGMRLICPYPTYTYMFFEGRGSYVTEACTRVLEAS